MRRRVFLAIPMLIAAVAACGGVGSDGPQTAYQPPCSQGSGAKLYTFALHALSASPALPALASQVTGPVLTAAIANITLGSASLRLSYTRPQ